MVVAGDEVKVLVTGKGGSRSGSWKIRGEQLGRAMAARVTPLATIEDCQWADIIIVVKRPPGAVIQAIRESKKPWVWDMVDGWPQPSPWGKPEAVAWLKAYIERLQPTAAVFGTQQMMMDSEYFGPRAVVPHHSWDRYIAATPCINDTVSVVGYEGNMKWLGRWARLLSTECNKRGWSFQVNGDMTQADIGIALRDPGGYPARYWKPGTKLSNLHALGIPALCSREAGYESVACGSEVWMEQLDAKGIASAFDYLEDFNTRKAISERMRSAILNVGEVAKKYRQWLVTIL